MKILKVLGLIAAIVLFVVLGAGLYINFSQPNVGDAPVLTLVADSNRIERGRYLANHVAVCIDCHSTRDWTVFSGPVIKGTEGRGGEAFTREAGFPGNIYATNLTPTTLASWTDGEIYRAIASGVSKDGHALFPLMGYQRFGKMSREDIESIILYLRTLQPIQHLVPKSELDFPVSLLNKLSPEAPAHQELPTKADTIKYGGYLVNAAGCVDCHSKQDKGKIVKGSAFGGGMEFRQRAGVIRAPNITMDLSSGLGNWTSELFVAKFKAYADTNLLPKKLAPNELNSPMPWKMYSGMSEYDLKAIYSYLKSLKPIVNKVEIRTYHGVKDN